jgi:nicotinamide mononucleotide adenylyltransferase
MDVHKTIALIPLAAKPYHAGHDGLVRIASSENDEVHLFVSISDRARTGEMKIDGETMFMIWKDYIEDTLPDNVKSFMDYTVTAPVSKVYNELENAESQRSQDVYTIYSDVDDIRKYTDEMLSKVAPTLFSKGQIQRRGIERTETVDVSGTEMREFIEDGDIVGFTALLPPAIQQRGKEIFDLLVDDVVGESVLRRYIRSSLKFVL